MFFFCYHVQQEGIFHRLRSLKGWVAFRIAFRPHALLTNTVSVHEAMFIVIRLETITSSNKKLLGAPGIATRSKDAITGSWPYY